MNQRGARADEQRAHEKDAEDAPEQHAVLKRCGNGEIAEDQRNHEDVVERQALLDDITGQEAQACVRPELMPDPGAEKDRKRTRMNSSHYCASRLPSSA